MLNNCIWDQILSETPTVALTRGTGEIITQHAYNKPASGPLNVRLSAAKMRFSRSKFRMFHALHIDPWTRKKIRKTSIVQANSKVTFHIISRAYESCPACQHFISNSTQKWNKSCWLKKENARINIQVFRSIWEKREILRPACKE